MEERIKIWLEIRDSATKLHKAGVNPGAILRWSRKKTLNEVQLRLHEILCKCEEENNCDNKRFEVEVKIWETSGGILGRG